MLLFTYTISTPNFVLMKEATVMTRVKENQFLKSTHWSNQDENSVILMKTYSFLCSNEAFAYIF